MAKLDRKSFQELASVRLSDARLLLAQGRFAAAFYLAGYVVECSLKAGIARGTEEFEFPDRKRVQESYSHDLEQLLGLMTQIPRNEKRTPMEFDTYKALGSNWAFVCTKWSASRRYEMATQKEAEDLVAGITDPDHGVLQWLQKYW